MDGTFLAKIVLVLSYVLVASTAVILYSTSRPHQPAPTVPDTWTITATATCPDGSRHDLDLPAHLADNSDLVIDGDIPNPCTP